MLPFTREQFFAVFAQYNDAVWPVQVAAYLLGAAIVVALWRQPPWRDRVVGAGLAAMWIWTGVGYHGLHFASINKAAFAFGALFVLQGALLLRAAVVRDHLRFGTGSGARGWLGWALIGGSAAFLLGVPQDWMLLLGGVAATAMLMRDRRPAEST